MTNAQALPAYASLVKHPRTGVVFVKVGNKLIPNQGTSSDPIQNFWDWVAKDRLHASVICGDRSLFFGEQ